MSTEMRLSVESPTWSCSARAFNGTFICASPSKSPLAAAGAGRREQRNGHVAFFKYRADLHLHSTRGLFCLILYDEQ